jgi:hypothetical protein
MSANLPPTGSGVQVKRVLTPFVASYEEGDEDDFPDEAANQGNEDTRGTARTPEGRLPSPKGENGRRSPDHAHRPAGPDPSPSDETSGRPTTNGGAAGRRRRSTDGQAAEERLILSASELLGRQDEPAQYVGA